MKVSITPKVTITPQMADALVALYKDSWAVWPLVSAGVIRLRYWGLVESTGGGVLWRISDRGKQFVEGKIAVSQCCWIEAGQVQGFDGPLVSFSDVLS